MADTNEHDWEFDFCHPHNGEYWHTCKKCGATDWIASYGTLDQLMPAKCKPTPAQLETGTQPCRGVRK